MNASGMAIIDIIFNIISSQLVKWCHSAERFNISRPLQKMFATVVRANFWIDFNHMALIQIFLFPMKRIANMELHKWSFFTRVLMSQTPWLIDSLLLLITVHHPEKLGQPGIRCFAARYHSVLNPKGHARTGSSAPILLTPWVTDLTFLNP